MVQCGPVLRSGRHVQDYGAANEAFEFTADSPLLTQRDIALDAPTVEMLHANHCPFIHDIDDLLWAIPPDYQGAHRTLPVMRLPNTGHAWLTAIADRIHDEGAMRKEGTTLRRAVQANLLVDTWAERNLKAWIGSHSVPAIA